MEGAAPKESFKPRVAPAIFIETAEEVIVLKTTGQKRRAEEKKNNRE